MYDSQYDEEPVYYCADCHSLNIAIDEDAADAHWDGSYCCRCGGTDIRQCSIFEWLEEETRRHGAKKR